MTRLGTIGRVVALSVAALALTSGMAGAASAGKGDRPSVAGTVTSVNGTSTPGTCGTPDNNGVFVITTTSGNPPVSVDTTVTVTPSTAFAEHRNASPSFADVCVGDRTTAIGTSVDHAMTALAVAITVPKATHVFGFVTSVNGDSTQGVCGTASSAGQFTVQTLVNSAPVDLIVYVAPDTAFREPHVADASFGNLCVGGQADAVGPSADGAVVATLVAIRVPKPIKFKGYVVAVNGDTTAGSCGSAGGVGGFTVESTDHGVVLDRPVAVSSSTTFADAKDLAPSFADVCVGARALSIGNSVSGTLDAEAVAVYPAKA